MTDFASNILFTLVARQLARQGIAAPGDLAPAPTRGTVDLADKSTLLSAVYATHGALPILRIGQGVGESGPEPTLQALMMARDPKELVVRWQRLERYVHSRHRVLLRREEGHELLLEHVSIRDGETPSAGEDLLILGLLLALSEAVGAEGLTAALVGPRSETPVYRDGVVLDPGRHVAGTALWRIGWRGTASGREVAAEASPLPFPVVDNARRLVDRLMALVMDDCTRPWALDAVARQLGHSSRTLQRRLREAGTSFGALVRTAQIRRATELLLDGSLSVAEIGLICGFSDQAHFTREFKRRTNISPGRYRAEFSS
ncbi:helix-turn-helix transcriptional regulator [Wenzhouxiangella sp. XN24]|uniref:helix-turn-helix transcriptional regulator n=1 Tax=Wenzhouxiangella sp. XN24 TaxID=2713569 RepID=UPI0013EC986A|nr:helix-turn-helix transcriptional regulator [Wenzhouxiangella sp. XN24]NGX16366.1 helix-turn-helix transcriptional regulator [Wenzhouxiangella sp. XN24]